MDEEECLLMIKCHGRKIMKILDYKRIIYVLQPMT